MTPQTSTPLLDMQSFQRTFGLRYRDVIEFVDKTSENGQNLDVKGEEFETIYNKIDSLCRFAQTMIDLDYESGISAIFSEIKLKPTDFEVSSAYMFVGATLILNLEKMEKENPEKARPIRDEVQLELDDPDEEASHYIIKNAINFIALHRINEGWDDNKRSTLQWDLTEPRPADSQRVRDARKQLRDEYFPRIQPHDVLIQNSVYLFADESDKVAEDDILKLPMLSLFFHSYRCIVADKDGYLRQDNIGVEEFVPLSKALYALHDIDADFTARFVGNMINHQSFQRNNVITYVLSDFLDQTSNYAFANRMIDEETYNERKNTARRGFGKAQRKMKYDVSITNFIGMIHERDEDKRGTFIEEHRQYLTPFAGDSNPQIKAKETIASLIPSFTK